MSEADQSLEAVMFDGRVKVRRHGPLGMVLLRGDLGDDRFRGAAGGDVPAPLCWTGGADGGVLWFSPDELLLLLPRNEATERAAGIGRDLDGVHHLAEDVSDARAVFTVEGDDVAVRETLARLTPADVSPGAAPKGTCRRTRLGQVPAALRFDEGRVDVFVFRSVAGYVAALLAEAASGAPLDLFAVTGEG